MGFSWAFHLAQRCHEFEAATVLPHADLLRDRRLFYRLVPEVSRLMLYTDNNNHIALDAETADSSRRLLSKRPNEIGLATHEVGDAAVCGSTLGIQFNGDIGYIAVTHERDVRLDLALEELIFRRPKITSADMRRIVGHITCRFLLRRALLATLAHVYVFINKEYTYPTTMWPSLVSELRVVRGLMVFAVAEMRKPLSTDVYMTDACLSGYGVVRAKWDFTDVLEVARFDERWRFKEASELGGNYREDALEEERIYQDRIMNANVFTDILSVREVEPRKRELHEDFKFPNVPARLLQADDWRGVWAVPLRFREAVHLCECRGVLACIRHLSRNRLCHGSKFVLLGDNLGLVLSLSKGRCSSPLLL